MTGAPGGGSAGRDPAGGSGVGPVGPCAPGSRRPSAAERIEQQEFARGHIAAGEEPVEPRPAATVVPARPAAGPPFEVLLLRRPESSRFAAGAYVFPGGVIDPGDRDPVLRAALGRSDAAPEETAALAAGIRELFEETGILPADRPPGPERRARAREALLADRTTLAEAVEGLGLTFHDLRAVYFARWITPERLSRRYDARFFLVAPGPGGWPEPELGREHTGYLWAGPAEAVEQFHRGELPMLFPTWKSLERLARFRGLEEALAELGTREVETVRPRLVVEEGRVRPVMPGDPGYERGG